MIRAALPALLALAPAAALAGPDGAAGRFSLPPACTGYMTVQSSDCVVTHHFTCEGDPEGWQRRVDLDADGISYFGAIDAEAQWLESVYVNLGHAEHLADDPVDPASFSTLLAEGRDTYDFITNSDEIGQTRYVGEDRLTGETVVIDGVTLDRTAFAIRALNAEGDEIWRSQGSEYISREHRIFVAGTGSFTTDGETFETEDSPVEFIFPGEQGFLSSNPKHGCGAVMSSAPATFPAKEFSDDHL